MIYICNCKKGVYKTDTIMTTFREVEVDDDEACVECGYYAMAFSRVEYRGNYISAQASLDAILVLSTGSSLVHCSVASSYKALHSGVSCGTMPKTNNGNSINIVNFFIFLLYSINN